MKMGTRNNSTEEVAANDAKCQPSRATSSDPTWSAKMKELQAFKEKSGGSQPVDGPLADWLGHQRALFAKGGLQKHQVTELRDVGCQGFEEGISNSVTPAKGNLLAKENSSGTAPPDAGKAALVSPNEVVSAKANTWSAKKHSPKLDKDLSQTPAKRVADTDSMELSAGGSMSNDRNGKNGIKMVLGVGARPTTIVAGMSPNNNVGNAPSQVESDAAWEARISDLKAYKRVFGHANPTWHENGQGPVNELSVWLEYQRTFFTQGIRLSPRRIQTLRDIGCTGFSTGKMGEKEETAPGPAMPVRDVARLVVWFGHFLELRYFKARTGHVNPSRDTTNATEKVLADWLEVQRAGFKQGATLFPKNVDLLREMGCKGFDKPPQAPASVKASSASSGVAANGKNAGDNATHNGLALAWQRKLGELEALMHSDDLQTEAIEQLNDNDVVCWEAGHTGYDIIYGMLPGNVQFRRVVSQEQKKHNLKNKQSVVEAAGEVVKHIRSMNPPGRFVSKGDEDGLWNDVGNVNAIKQALRALRKGSRASQHGDEADDEVYEGSGQEGDTMMECDDVETEGKAYSADMVVDASPSSKTSQMEEQYGQRRGDSAILVAWNARFEQLIAFKDQHGHVEPRESKKSCNAQENKVARWIREQRTKLRAGKLPIDLCKKLRDLGCSGFDIDSPAPKPKPAKKPRTNLPWEARFQELCAFKERMGHANPNQSRTASEKDIKLAKWLSDQRKSSFQGNLSAERTRKLHELGSCGFEIEENDTKKPRCAPWEKRYLELQVYKDRFGHCEPRESTKGSDIENRLGRWLREQRKKFQDGILSPERAQSLVDLGCSGFENETHGTLQTNAYQEETHGALFTRSDSGAENGQLYQGSTGESYEDEEPVNTLSSSGRVTPWHNRFLDLKAFKEMNGHANPKRSRESSDADYKLAAWLCRQRVLFTQKKLEEDRIRKLRSLGCTGFDGGDHQSDLVEEGSEENEAMGDSDLKSRKTWDSHFFDLQAFIARHGHATPQQNRGTEPVLVRWLNDQRFKFRRGTLGPEKARKLREVGCNGFDEEDPATSGLNENDVVCGRGANTNSWPGNIQFRTLVQQRKKDYNARKRHQKIDVAKEIVNQIRMMSPPGRFLSQEANGYVDVGEARALKKVSQALREPGGEGEDQSAVDSGGESELEAGLEYGSDCGNGRSERRESTASRRNSATQRRGSLAQQRRESSQTERRDSLSRKNVKSWESHFADLEVYKAKHGHADPGCSRGPDYRLGHWLSDQRYKHRRGDLNQEKSLKLYKIGCKGFEGAGGDESDEEEEEEDEEFPMDYDSDSSQESSLQLLTRKRRFGVYNPPMSTCTRSGRNVHKKQKTCIQDYEYF